jgi:CsoR family transcriptional regulator, copper-sensing transcriptional repressor
MGSASKLTDSRRRVRDSDPGEALMENVTKAGVIRRLQSIDGHVRGIQRMVEEDQYCIDVIKQIDAVEAALRKVQEIVLDSHLHTCVTTAIRGDDAERREAVLDEIMGVFSVSNK